MTIRAVLWDFGGVLTTSPFARFADYEARHGLPKDFIRSVNANNPHDNAWARFEKNAISAETFNRLFAEESRALGHEVPGGDILPLLKGALRPAMVQALKRIKALGYLTACITNNIMPSEDAHQMAENDAASREMGAVMALFDHVVESSKAGIRKPDPRIYEMACQALGISPEEAIYLDDLGINLKPARAMGMRTIKVLEEEEALKVLEKELGADLR